MADRHTLKLVNSNRAKAYKGIEAAILKSKQPGATPWTLELRPRTRTDDQNDALHSLVTQIMKQRTHHNGIRMDKALWKATFMEALGEEVRFIPKLNGDGLFPLGLSTSKLSVERFAELIELVLAWMAQEGLTINHFDGQGTGVADKAPPKAA